MYRTMGSLGFVAAARAGWLVVSDKDDQKRRLFLPQKANLAPEMTGLAYRVESHPETPSIGVICWEPEPVMMTADEALAADRAGDGTASDRDQATDWLRDLLRDGPAKSTDVLSQARANGFSERTIRRAYSHMGGKPKKVAFTGGWEWPLPVEDGQDGQS